MSFVHLPCLPPAPNTSMAIAFPKQCSLPAEQVLHRYTVCPGVTYNEASGFETETCFSGPGQSGVPSAPIMQTLHHSATLSIIGHLL